MQPIHSIPHRARLSTPKGHRAFYKEKNFSLADSGKIFYYFASRPSPPVTSLEMKFPKAEISAAIFGPVAQRSPRLLASQKPRPPAGEKPISNPAVRTTLLREPGPEPPVSCRRVCPKAGSPARPPTLILTLIDDDHHYQTFQPLASLALHISTYMYPSLPHFYILLAPFYLLPPTFYLLLYENECTTTDFLAFLPTHYHTLDSLLTVSLITPYAFL